MIFFRDSLWNDEPASASCPDAECAGVFSLHTFGVEQAGMFILHTSHVEYAGVFILHTSCVEYAGVFTLHMRLYNSFPPYYIYLDTGLL